MILAIVLMYIFRPLIKEKEWLECTESSGGGTDCFGISIILRASFTLAMYHFLILIILCPRIACSAAFHDGLWILKNIIMMAVFIASFWIPNDFFVFWSQICRVGSVLFLIVQAYFILNSTYIFGDRLIEIQKEPNGGTYA